MLDGTMTIIHKNPIPSTNKMWKKEIAEAYLDAKEAIPCAHLIGQKMTEKELFHLAPAVCLKFRGIKKTDKILKKATEFTLANYIANIDINNDSLSDPYIAFSFCYVVCHLGLDLIDEHQVGCLMDYLEQRK